LFLKINGLQPFSYLDTLQQHIATQPPYPRISLSNRNALVKTVF